MTGGVGVNSHVDAQRRRQEAGPKMSLAAQPAPISKGKHLLVDCRNVPRAVCLDDKTMLATMAAAALQAGANVIGQMRYKFGVDSPPGFAAVIMLDESHCSAHSYADDGLIAIDLFTCGTTNPRDILAAIQKKINLGDVTITEIPRFKV